MILLYFFDFSFPIEFNSRRRNFKTTALVLSYHSDSMPQDFP